MNKTPPTPPQAITVQELARWRDADEPHVVVDVRTPAELAICRLDTLRHIPMNEIPQHVETLPSDRPIVVVCHLGVRSAHVVALLRRAGLTNAVNLQGGMDAWARQIDPAMAVY